eukprot:2391051-Pyramimonas_sp.AAC.1
MAWTHKPISITCPGWHQIRAGEDPVLAASSIIIRQTKSPETVSRAMLSERKSLARRECRFPQ